MLVAPCVVGSDGNRDGLPTVLVEAMALERARRHDGGDGNPELVEDGRTGLIVPERDPGALARAIQGVLTDPRSAAGLVEAGRRRIERDFDLNVNVAELRRLLEEPTHS